MTTPQLAMDSATNPCGADSSTGSTGSTASSQTRKHERGTEVDADDHDLPSKRNSRVVIKPPKPAKTALEAVLSKLNDVSLDIANQRVLLQDLPVIRAVVDSTSSAVATRKPPLGNSRQPQTCC